MRVISKPDGMAPSDHVSPKTPGALRKCPMNKGRGGGVPIEALLSHATCFGACTALGPHGSPFPAPPPPPRLIAHRPLPVSKPSYPVQVPLRCRAACAPASLQQRAKHPPHARRIQDLAQGPLSATMCLDPLASREPRVPEGTARDERKTIEKSAGVLEERGKGRDKADTKGVSAPSVVKSVPRPGPMVSPQCTSLCHRAPVNTDQ